MMDVSRRFKVTSSGNSQPFRQLCEQHVNELWIPVHLTDDQAEAFAIEHLQKWIASEVELLVIETRAADAAD